jgi:hypothetical protein
MAATRTKAPPLRPKSTSNKYDVEIAKAVGRMRLVEQIVAGLKLIALLAFIRWYLNPVDDMVNEIAGKDTGFHFTMTAQISIAVTVAITVTGVAAVVRKTRRQGADLRRLREKLQAYDDDLLT